MVLVRLGHNLFSIGKEKSGKKFHLAEMVLGRNWESHNPPEIEKE
jgi:hypothetical protein